MENPVLEKIKEMVETAGSQAQIAEELEISPSYLHDILKGKREISNAIAIKVGYERIIVYKSLNIVSVDQLPGPADADRPIRVTVQRE
jgi:hypothetical protein